MAAVTTAGQMETTLRSTEEVVSLLQERLAYVKLRAHGPGSTAEAVALEHALADHEGRSGMHLWPRTHELVDLVLADALGVEHVTTTWPGQ